MARHSIKSQILHHAVIYVFAVFSGSTSSACSAVPNNSAANAVQTRDDKKDVAALRTAIRKIEPYFKPMGPPAAYDWLGSHNEAGQTFEQYLDSKPTRPTADRKKIYVLPLGKFDTRQQKVISQTADYLEVFYGLPVTQMPAVPFSAVHPNVRENRFTHTRQVKSGYILKDVLPPMLPKDAAAMIAFTADDLYPDDTMNYVFGQASLDDRVGVWSLFRPKDLDTGKFLRRTLKIAAHETGHMFSMRHCTKFECVMSGTNQLAETDRRPIDACPECMAKICWISDEDPKKRYERLAAFCRKNGLTAEAAEFDRKANSVA